MAESAKRGRKAPAGREGAAEGNGREAREGLPYEGGVRGDCALLPDKRGVRDDSTSAPDAGGTLRDAASAPDAFGVQSSPIHAPDMAALRAAAASRLMDLIREGGVSAADLLKVIAADGKRPQAPYAPVDYVIRMDPDA
ncbi:MAG TPA: hypothetical protein VLA21_02645 [Candidatus Limnocylindria bacterium]|nr:hypothetical protein [Candidatus Limnocylindria bacterium]